MATINNLSEAASAAVNDAISNGATSDVPAQPGVVQFTVEGQTVFTSENDINLGTEANDAVLTGTSDAAVTGNEQANLIVGNDGDNTIDAGASDDQVSTGNGDDNVSLGDGDDTVEIDGTGNKTIDGGAGDDTFIIKPAATGSHTTLTGLNSGDKVRISADANGDGVIDLNDVDLDQTSEDGLGNTTITLVDGTSFTLTGVTGAFEGNIKYTFGEDEDGNLIVDLTDGTV